MYNNAFMLTTLRCSLVLKITMVWESLVLTHQSGSSLTTLQYLLGKGQGAAASLDLRV